MENLIKECIEILGITKPVDIRLKTRLPRKYKDTRAIHYTWIEDNGDILRHVIQVAMIEDDRNLETIIAHEFIHAWQAEYKPKDRVHGKGFQNVALTLLGYLVSKGYNIQDDIYCPVSDT